MNPNLSGWVGTIIANRWRIDSKIARGGVATVFKASERGGPSVAVKIMHPEYCRNEDARGRFLREGYAANKVGHPGVVKVTEDGSTPDGSVFLVMELLEDGELLETKRERLGGMLLQDEVVRIGDRLLDVLSSAHAQGIVHRDIKPENLFMLTDGTLKVLDFGIAHIKDHIAKTEPTATGLLLGTPDFMSPEQAQGMRGTIDQQTDVYAVGATMFTLLSGEAVHVEQALGTLLHATATKQARSLNATRAAQNLAPELIEVVDKSLRLLKPERYPSARAMQEALRKACPPARTQILQRPIAARIGTASAQRLSRPPLALAQTMPKESAAPPTAPVTKPQRPAMEEPKPPSDRTVMTLPLRGMKEEQPDSDRTMLAGGADAAWSKPFAEGEMEDGATVALDAPRGHRSNIVDEQAATQAVDLSQRPLPPPPRTPSMMPPPMSHAPNTPPMHTLPKPQHQSIPPPATAPVPNHYQTGPQREVRNPHSMPPPPPGRSSNSMPPPPPGRSSNSMPPPPQTPQQNRPQSNPSMPPPPPGLFTTAPLGATLGSNTSRARVGPATPRTNQWATESSPIAASAPLNPMAPQPAKKPPKPPSILIAEIVLAALVIVTLTIGGCLLLRK